MKATLWIALLATWAVIAAAAPAATDGQAILETEEDAQVKGHPLTSSNSLEGSLDSTQQIVTLASNSKRILQAIISATIGGTRTLAYTINGTLISGQSLSQVCPCNPPKAPPHSAYTQPRCSCF